MKKMILPIFILLALLGGCQNSDSETKMVEKETTEQKQPMNQTSEVATAFPYPNLLSKNEKTYSLFVIGEQNEENPIEENKKVGESINDILSLPTLEMAQNAYPELTIETDPAYLLFNSNELVFQTNNLLDLIAYLEENK